ncbi:RNA-directed DNA polymerase from mobile element jockey [Trichonephila clavipes]|nr:RNA-directed DNA polymerase from mobile element jockey [Trichonephila clavipes]
MFWVQETWLEPGIDPQIANYRFTKDDRIEIPQTVTRGGTAIYCKNEIVHNRVLLPNLKGMDATAVQIKINNFSPINIVSAYVRRVGHNFPIGNFNKIFNSGSNCIIAGDYNAAHVSWHNAKSTRCGHALHKLIRNLRGAKLIAPPTSNRATGVERSSTWRCSSTFLSTIVSEFLIISALITTPREIAKDIQAHSRAQWEKHIEALLPVDNTLWRKSSLLRKPFQSIPPLKGALGSIAITLIEKAEVIADSLQEQFEPNHVVGRELFYQRIHDEVTNFINTPHVQEIEPTTPTEVLTYVQRLKPRKSPGLDQIFNRMIKNLPLKFLLFITRLINQLFKNNYFPSSWKTAVVIPILKPEKDSALPSNYRPISLLSCLSKVYEFVLLQRLNQHCTASNFIIPQQCGFRPKCSTVLQLLRITELIHSGFAKHEATGILFLDIAKAFDKIWHDGLLIKLIRLDFPPPIKSIHSFLSNRSFRVRVDRMLSSPRPIRSGLPQGSLSSPLLFTLYVNDIPQTDLSHLAMFADDTAIITQNKRFSVVISNLQHYISLLELWLTDWKVKVNASKSACLMFTRRPRLPVGLTPVQIFGQPVPRVHVAKYLGLYLDAKLTFAHHIEQTRKKAHAVHDVLKRLISRKSKLAIRHKVLLYKSIIRPVMSYESQIFGSAGMCHLKKLHTLTNSFLRQIVNAPWFHFYLI